MRFVVVICLVSLVAGCAQNLTAYQLQKRQESIANMPKESLYDLRLRR